MTLYDLTRKLKPFNFDWSNYHNDERTVVEQTRKAIQYYKDMGVIDSTTTCRINHRASRKAGTYCYVTQVVTIYAWLFRNNSAQEVENTIKHEIAHAIDIHNYGIRYRGSKRILHGHTWKAIARAIGDDGERCYDGKTVKNDAKKHKYTLRTQCCGYETTRQRLTTRIRRSIESGSAVFSCCNRPRSERRIIIIENK